MEGQELKELGAQCDCPERIPWLHLVLKVYANKVLGEEWLEDYKTYFSMRKKQADEIINDFQQTQAKIFLPLIFAMYPAIDWEEITDEQFEEKVAGVFDIAARIPKALVPPPQP